jgi:hypothetical protein
MVGVWRFLVIMAPTKTPTIPSAAINIQPSLPLVYQLLLGNNSQTKSG